MERLAIVCPAGEPRCPHLQCGRLIDEYGGRVAMNELRFRTCPWKTGRHGKGRQRCGQRALIAGLSGDRCMVWRISDEEYDTLNGSDRSAIEIMYDLGVLAATVVELDRSSAA